MILMQQAQIWFANPTWEALDSDADIVAHVAADPLAVGFASIGYDDGVRYLGIRMKRHGKPALPSLEEIEREDYGLAKVIYVYCVAPPDAAAGAAIDYLFSADGRRAIESTSVWPIPSDRAATAAAP
jgi:ABC-type phosphate transport system substrate-binding protein